MNAVCRVVTEMDALQTEVDAEAPASETTNYENLKLRKLKAEMRRRRERHPRPRLRRRFAGMNDALQTESFGSRVDSGGK
jgi:hypothetical protein